MFSTPRGKPFIPLSPMHHALPIPITKTLHHYPLSLYQCLANRILRRDGYLVIYFHPWEFGDKLLKYKVVPFYIKKNSGKKLVKRLTKVILSLKKKNEFVTYTEYVKSVVK